MYINVLLPFDVGIIYLLDVGIIYLLDVKQMYALVSGKIHSTFPEILLCSATEQVTGH